MKDKIKDNNNFPELCSSLLNGHQTTLSLSRYCSFCGKNITVSMEEADKNKIMIYPESMVMSYDTRYNPKTGKKQYCPFYKCPNSTRFFNQHDKYFINEIWVRKEVEMGWRKEEGSRGWETN